MRVSVVVLWFCLSCVQLQRADDQLVVGDEQGEQLEFIQSQTDELKKQNTVVDGSADSVEETAEAPGEENSIGPRVGFSYASGINGNLGPRSSGVIVPFHKRITDVGNSYDPATGVFTAPLRGVYYFRFNVYGSSFFYSMGVCLYKNHVKILDVSKSPRGSYRYSTGGATLLLQKGDRVYVWLKRNSQIHDDSNDHCTFSGFLLFRM